MDSLRLLGKAGVFLIRFVITTKIDNFLKAKLPDKIFKSLFHLCLYLRPTVDMTADTLTIQKPVEKARERVLRLCCGACSASLE